MKRARGFTLLEVLVAMTLFAVLMAALMPGLHTGLRTLTSADERYRALVIARSVLNEQTHDTGLTPMPVALSGEMDGFRWRIERAPFIEQELITNEDSSVALVHVTALVESGEGEVLARLSSLSIEAIAP